MNNIGELSFLAGVNRALIKASGVLSSKTTPSTDGFNNESNSRSGVPTTAVFSDAGPFLADIMGAMSKARQALSDVSKDDSDIERAGEVLMTFTCFKELIPELRLRIWTFACFLPRNVCVEMDLSLMERISGRWNRDPEEHDIAYLSNTEPPALLRVCKESRTEALRHYSLEFGTTMTSYSETAHLYKRRSFTVTVPPVVWINWAADTLWMPDVPVWDFDVHLLKLASIFEAKGLTSLALNILDGRTDCTMMIPAGRHLKELILFTRDFPLADTFKTVRFVDIPHGEQTSKWKSLGISRRYEFDVEVHKDRKCWWNLLDGDSKDIRRWIRKFTPFSKNRPHPQLRICEIVIVEE